MTWCSFLVAATLAVGLPLLSAGAAVAQQPAISADLMQRLQGTSPADLAAQARSALDTLNQMPPDQRKAAEAAAQAQIPSLMGAATDWWAKLSPDQQAAFRQQLQGIELLSK